MFDQASAATARPLLTPDWLRHQSAARKASAVFLGTLFLALSSHVEVPMIPVPITMQTFAVTLVGALFGWRLGAVTVLAWLAEGAAGLPVLASGTIGLAHFMGPTGGYLLAFPFAAALTGWLTQHGWNGQRPLRAFVSMLLGNGLCLALGAAWLATMIGLKPAFMHGVAPFLTGSVLKAALGAAVLAALSSGWNRGKGKRTR